MDAKFIQLRGNFAGALSSAMGIDAKPSASWEYFGSMPRLHICKVWLRQLTEISTPLRSGGNGLLVRLEEHIKVWGAVRKLLRDCKDCRLQTTR